MAKYQSGLIARNIKLLKQKEWYNQRFDGCLNLIWMIAELHIKAEKRKLAGGNCTSHLCIFDGQKADWYMDLADIKRIASVFIRRAAIENHLGKKLMRQWSVDDKKLSAFFARLDKVDLKKLSSQELRKLYSSLTDHYHKAISYSSLIDGFALGSDEIIQAEINKLLDQRGIVKGRGVIFSNLTASVHQSFINQAEISLFTIAERISKFKDMASALNNPAVKKLIAAHAAKYCWIKNNYFDRHILTPAYFIKELRSILKSSVNLQQEIRRIKDAPLINKKEKQALLKKLAPSRSLRNLLAISEDFTYWQDERKKRTMLFTHYALCFLEEIARRFHIPPAAVKCLSQDEARTILAGGKIDRAELTKRISHSFIYQKGEHYEILSGHTAENVAQQIFEHQDQSHIQDFRGLTASTGRARGLAKIVTSVKEIDKVKVGDILVAVMTRPDYIMGIKKAAAIVTDEGGITCHAAIISRELGIPCIIGTKIGTKILKDGDLIEVNANHGWIRKIK
ncbi:MAG: PEP-utilizing enzyme [Patescibacteria group bacterium]